MVAVSGGGIALGGLLLVFVGFLFGQAASLEGLSNPGPKATRDRFRRAARWGLLPFGASLSVAMLSLAYWLLPCDGFAKAVLFLFWACTLGSLLYGVLASFSL